MELQKMLKLISVAQAHPDTMSAEQVAEWMSTLQALRGVWLNDVSGASHLRCRDGVFQSNFSIHFGNVAKMDVTLIQVAPGSKKYSVKSTTEYFNGTKSQHGTKGYNTLQQEILRQQELFQQRQHDSARNAIEHHQQHVRQHMQHVMLHNHIHHHNNF